MEKQPPKKKKKNVTEIFSVIFKKHDYDWGGKLPQGLIMNIWKFSEPTQSSAVVLFSGHFDVYSSLPRLFQIKRKMSTIIQFVIVELKTMCLTYLINNMIVINLRNNANISADQQMHVHHCFSFAILFETPMN